MDSLPNACSRAICVYVVRVHVCICSYGFMCALRSKKPLKTQKLDAHRILRHPTKRHVIHVT